MASAHRKRELRRSETFFRSLTLALRPPLSVRWPSVSPLVDVEDRRRYHPLRQFRAPKMLSGHAVGPLRVSRPRSVLFSPRLSFPVPERTVICVRRGVRREVLFAHRSIRAGAGKRRRRNYWSNISCRS